MIYAFHTFDPKYLAAYGPNDSVSFTCNARTRPASQCGLPSSDAQNTLWQSSSGSVGYKNVSISIHE